ncbi:MAG: hypothetical protein JXN65_00745 [Clostridia bacterium]|nr:hypothetical protein [Clostridia bacterium]
MSKPNKTTVFLEYFEGIHSIINEWAENSVFKAGGLFVPEFIDEYNANYCFQTEKQGSYSYIVILIKNSKVKIQGWIKVSKIVRQAAYYLIPEIIPLSKKTNWGILRSRRNVKDFNSLIERLHH